MQKTIAKWLVILLLCTISVGSFLLYDALSDSGSAVGADQTDNTDDTEKPENLEEPYIPFYTTLPRETTDFGTVKAAHVGGGKDEFLLSAISFGQKSLLFFSTTSSDGDLRSSGLAVAYFENDSLISVSTFANGGTFCDCKLTTSGVAVTTREDNGGKLYMFSTDGTLKAETNLDTFVSGKLFLFDKSLLWFYIDGSRLKCAQILSDASVHKFAFLYDTSILLDAGAEIKQVFGTAEKMTVIIGADNGTLGVDFFIDSGFNSAFYLINRFFKQILTVSGESGTSYIVATKENDVPVLCAFETDWSPISVRRIEDASCGIALVKDDSLVFYGNGTTIRTCRHLDVAQKTTNNASFENVLSYGSGDGYALIEDAGAVSLVKIDAALNTHGVFYTMTSQSGRAMWIKSSNKINLMFSSKGSDGYCSGNFGGYDVFSLSFDIDNPPAFV